jgi:hypothetical protein
MYNMVAEYLPAQSEALRGHVGGLVSTVVLTKFHAMIDVAFGLFLVRRIVEHGLGLEFRDLQEFFVREQGAKDGVPYERIYGIYRDINALDAAMGERTPLPELMEMYFRETGLPRVRREKSNCVYDLQEKRLTYPEGLKVGWGLV